VLPDPSNPESAWTTQHLRLGDSPPAPPPQTARELAAALLGVIGRYRESQGGNPSTDVALALAIAQRETFRLGRR
jgi:hypothetical protein